MICDAPAQQVFRDVPPTGTEYANCANALADFVSIPGAKGPTCKKNGLWAAKQCNGSILGGACTCSNPWGEEIPCPDKDPIKVLQRHVTEVTGVLEANLKRSKQIVGRVKRLSERMIRYYEKQASKCEITIDPIEPERTAEACETIRTRFNRMIKWSKTNSVPQCKGKVGKFGQRVQRNLIKLQENAFEKLSCE